MNRDPIAADLPAWGSDGRDLWRHPVRVIWDPAAPMEASLVFDPHGWAIEWQVARHLLCAGLEARAEAPAGAGDLLIWRSSRTSVDMLLRPPGGRALYTVDYAPLHGLVERSRGIVPLEHETSGIADGEWDRWLRTIAESGGAR